MDGRSQWAVRRGQDLLRPAPCDLRTHLLHIQREIIHHERRLQRRILGAHEVHLNRLPLVRRDVERLLRVTGVVVQVRIRGERLIRISLAGPIAQRKFNPRSIRRYHGEQDFKKAYDLLAYLAISDEHAQIYMQHLEIEAAGIVDRHWPVIKALAAEIMARRKMKGAEATRFIGEWFTTDNI